MATTVEVVRGRDGHPLAGVDVSDGRRIVSTDGRGTAELPGDRPLVFVHRPSGWSCDRWWHRSGRPQRLVFELEEIPQPSIVRFAHITDLHLSEAVDVARTKIATLRRPSPGQRNPDNEAAAMRELASVEEIEALLAELSAGEPGIDFIVATGDLTDRSTEWELATYARLAAGCRVAVHSIPGNHDLLGAGGDHGRLNSATYEHHLGPRWYSFDHGALHIVAIDSSEWRWGDDNDAQREWLAADLARHRGRPLIVLTHDQLDETFYGQFPDPPVATFSGHWHTSRVVRDPAGTTHVNSGTPFMGGLDWSPPHHRIVVWDGDTLAVTAVARAGSEDPVASSPPPWFGFGSGHEPGPGELTSGTRWVHRTPGTTYRLPVVTHDGVAIAASRDDDRAEGWVDAIDIAGGELRWRFCVPEPIKAPPLIIDGLVVVVTVAGRVVAIETADGSQRWQSLPVSWLRHWCVLRPVTDGDTVAVGDVAGYRGLGLADGEQRWNRTDLGAHINHVAYAQPVVVDGAAILGFWPQGPGLQAVELADGSSRWPCASPRDAYRDAGWGEHMGQAASSGLCADPGHPSVYTACSNGDLVRVDAGDGSVMWRSPIGGLFQTAEPVVADDVVIVAAHGRGVHAVDRCSGAVRWVHEVTSPAGPALAPYWRHGRALHAGATVVGERVLVPLRDGRVQMVSIADGHLIGSVELGVEVTEPLTFVDGGVLVSGIDGSIRLLDETAALLGSPGATP
ncbi:MAG: PQQ-binding-like beta-propeller repeat protein [Acidimicrobiales bacterium]